MKKTKAAIPASPETPVFPQTLHRLRVKPAAIPKGGLTVKRENTFSKSRDIREDRSERQIKTSHNPQTNHAR